MADTAGRELWIAVSRARETCDITVDVVANPPGWEVILRPKKTPQVSIQATSEHLLDAFVEVIARGADLGIVRGI